MSTDCITFTVIGEAKPKGSARGFAVGRRVVITNDCAAAKPWQQQVHWTAREAVQEAGLQPWAGPVYVMIAFVLPRPLRLGKKRSGVPHGNRPDLDKLTRTALDALTGVCFLDDGQVARLHVTKRYADPAEPAGATITVQAIEVV